MFSEEIKKATAALSAIRQIQAECLVNQADTGNIGSFSASNLKSYEVQSNGFNSCSGVSEGGLISVIPTDTKTLPTFILSMNTNQLSYSYKGVSGIKSTTRMFGLDLWRK